MGDITLRQIEAFLAVASCGSFSKAAEELFLNQSTVSAHIGALEQSLGVRLFVRGGRRTALTEEGRRALPKAKRIADDCSKLSNLFGEEDRLLVLGASSVPGRYLLPEYTARFLRTHPVYRYQLRLGNTEQIHAMLGSGEIRIGFVGAMLDTDNTDYYPLAEDRLVVITQNSPEFMRLKRNGCSGRELLDRPLIAREEGSGTDRSVLEYLKRTDYPEEKLNIVARVEDPEAIKRMAAEGAGIAVMSARAAGTDGSLLCFELGPEPLRRIIYLALRRGEEYTAWEKEFIAFLKKTK
ncbi:MAG: LysR family transcriptional regulator [Oscillospiraceae bacterium]|nr:LysR family transcriptional regulator [Oscillospiraceae bacterium]